jgi:Zn-dependent protease with chaperone function
MLLSALGLASAAFVTTRLFESWRVTSGPASHVISLFGQRISYPAANVGAIAVTALAALGLAMAAAAGSGLVREVLADRRFRRRLARLSPAPRDGAWVIPDPQPRAFCAGLLNPRVYVSTGALEMLDAPGLAAVLAHEQHHALRHDPLRLACGRALTRALFFIPGHRDLVERQHALAEISADDAAVVAAGGDRQGLASAMLRFSDASRADRRGVDPARVDNLLGEPGDWRLPILLCVAIAAALSLLVTLAVLAAHVAAGSATLAPPFLSGEPCIAILAMVPVSVGLGSVLLARGRDEAPTVQLNPQD